MRNLPALAESLMPIAERAGAAIMRIYDSGFTVQRKDDNSPLDRKSTRLNSSHDYR
jgi:3'-phosphoadenosine 5'-phosphosulfate (PAPS) 3'-phosphatase